MDCPICKAPGMCICPPAQARAVNILTPAALSAMADTFGEIHRREDLTLTEIWTQTFTAAIAKLIEEGRAWTEEYSQPFDETKPRKRLVIDTGEP